MPKKMLHQKQYEPVKEKTEVKDEVKQKMMYLKNVTADHHATVKAVDDQPMDHSHAAIIPVATDSYQHSPFSDNFLLAEQEDLLIGLVNSDESEEEFIPGHETLSLHIDDVLSPAESDLTQALDGLVTDSDSAPKEDASIQFNDASHDNITLKDVGTGDYSSIQDLLDAGMDIDITH